MNLTDFLIRRRGDDAYRVYIFPFLIFSYIVHSSKSEIPILFGRYVIWDLIVTSMLPFKKSGSWDDASFVFKRLLERRFLIDSLGFCISQIISYLALFRPMGYKSSFHQHYFILIFSLYHNRNFGSQCDIILCFYFKRKIIDIESFLDFRSYG